MSDFIQDLPVDSDIIPKSKPHRGEDWWDRCDFEVWIRENLIILGEGSAEDPFVYIRCPWAHEHTGETGDQDTQVYYSDGKMPRFFCHHAHCQGKTFKDILDELPKNTLDSFITKEPIKTSSETVDSDFFVSDAGVTGSFTSSDAEAIDIGDVSKIQNSTHHTIATIDNSLTFLGETMDGRIVIKSEDSEVLKVKDPASLSEKGLLSIYTSSTAWMDSFSDGKGKHQRLDVTAAVEWLLLKSKKAGSYDDKKRAALGLHWDHKDGRKFVVLNTGKNIYSEGKFYTYSESWKNFENYYILVSRKINFIDDVMPPDLPAKMFQILCKLSIKSKQEALVFFGANILLMMCGIVSIRPMVHVNGPRQSGKSQILSLISAPLIVASGGLVYSVGTSAAGLTQSIMGNVSFIFDEFEPDSATNERAIDQINDIMLAATTSGSDIYKGTKNQVPIQNSFKSGGIFGAIGNKARKPALEIRSIFINIINSGDTSEDWLAKKKTLEDLFCPKNCQMLFRFLVDHVDLFLANVEACSNLCAKEKGVETSTATLYGEVAGAFITAVMQRPFDPVKDRNVMKGVYNVMMQACEPKEKVFTEQIDSFINTFLSLELRDIHSSRSYTMQEMLKISLYNDTKGLEDCTVDSEFVLGYHGIKFDKKENVIWVSNYNKPLDDVFTKNGVCGYRDRLKNLKDSIKSKNPIYIGSIRTRAIGIPVSMLEDRLKPEAPEPADGPAMESNKIF